MLEERGKIPLRAIYSLRDSNSEALECRVILLTLDSDRKGILAHCANEKIVFDQKYLI